MVKVGRLSHELTFDLIYYSLVSFVCQTLGNALEESRANVFEQMW